MTATQIVTILSLDRVNELGRAFFAAQKSGERWICDAGVDDLAATILDRRARLRAVVVAAPEASFAPQPDNEQGQEVWSAGQCALHLVEAQYDVSEPAIVALASPGGVDRFVQPPPARDIPSPAVLGREAVLPRIDAATPDFERLLDSIPRDADLTATIADHRYFGTINLQAILLITAWHEQGHAAQIARLTS
jgi:hypothetical protein